MAHGVVVFFRGMGFCLIKINIGMDAWMDKPVGQTVQ